MSMSATGNVMAKIIVLLVIALFLPQKAKTDISNGGTRVVCYYTDWSVYRLEPYKFRVKDIDANLCTHLIYAFGSVTAENALKPFDEFQDITMNGYKDFNELKLTNSNLRTMLSIGGTNAGSSIFSPIVASFFRRQELIKNIIKYLRDNNFDGLDLAWQYPTIREGGKPFDRENYAQFVQELREEFGREGDSTDRPRLLLSMVVPQNFDTIDKGYDVSKLIIYLDWMNVIAYDYHSAAEETAVNHHSPITGMDDLNLDATIMRYVNAGADRNKLVLGMPVYGRSYTLVDPTAIDIGSEAEGPGDEGPGTRESGFLAYYEICAHINNDDWKIGQPDPNTMGPYAFKGNQWVAYDDVQIARKKAEYVVQMGFGGVMFWAIDLDDFKGTCGTGRYPLIEATKEALITATTNTLMRGGRGGSRPNTTTQTTATASVTITTPITTSTTISTTASTTPSTTTSTTTQRTTTSSTTQPTTITTPSTTTSTTTTPRATTISTTEATPRTRILQMPMTSAVTTMSTTTRPAATTESLIDSILFNFDQVGTSSESPDVTIDRIDSSIVDDSGILEQLKTLVNSAGSLQDLEKIIMQEETPTVGNNAANPIAPSYNICDKTKSAVMVPSRQYSIVGNMVGQPAEQQKPNVYLFLNIARMGSTNFICV